MPPHICQQGTGEKNPASGPGGNGKWLIPGLPRKERGKSTAGQDTRSFRKDLSVQSVFQGATKTSGRTSPESRGPPAKTDTGDPNPPMPFSWIEDHLRDIQNRFVRRNFLPFSSGPGTGETGKPRTFLEERLPVRLRFDGVQGLRRENTPGAPKIQRSG